MGAHSLLRLRVHRAAGFCVCRRDGGVRDHVAFWRMPPHSESDGDLSLAKRGPLRRGLVTTTGRTLQFHNPRLINLSSVTLVTSGEILLFRAQFNRWPLSS